MIELWRRLRYSYLSASQTQWKTFNVQLSGIRTHDQMSRIHNATITWKWSGRKVIIFSQEGLRRKSYSDWNHPLSFNGKKYSWSFKFLTAGSTLRKKGAKRVLRCPLYGTLALEPSKKVPEIQEPFGEPLKVLQYAQEPKRFPRVP